MRISAIDEVRPNSKHGNAPASKQLSYRCQMYDQQTGTRAAHPSERSRLVGIFLLIIGLLVSYFEIVQPLQEAAQGARRVTWTDNWSFMGVLCGLLGISVTIYPKMLSENSIFFKNKSKLSLFGWLMLVILVGATLALTSLFHHQFAKYGYHEVTPG